MNLTLENIYKNFANKIVLDDVTLHFQEGKIHGLLGENGAGKSTTANIICGEIQPDKGSIFINDKKTLFTSPKSAIKNRICYVHQKPYVAESITIAENLKIGINKKQIKQIPELMKIWLPEIEKNAIASNVGADIKFFIALISALLKSPEILILDEPTALLEENQKEFLFFNLKQLASSGMNILIITHNLDEAKKYCDTINCLENGKVIDSEIYFENHKYENSKTKIDSLNHQKIQINFNNIECYPPEKTSIKNISFICESGKITRIKGTTEDGLQTLEDILTGFNQFKCKGFIEIRNNNSLKKVNISKHPDTRFLRKKLGLNLGIVPTDRKERGANQELLINDIICGGKRIDNSLTEKIIEDAKIKCNAFEKVKNLSGGMLQRLIISREIFNNPDFLILCHPFQGLDSKICDLVYTNILKLAKNGTAILVLTAGDFPQNLCDYSYVLSQGSIR